MKLSPFLIILIFFVQVQAHDTIKFSVFNQASDKLLQSIQENQSNNDMQHLSTLLTQKICYQKKERILLAIKLHEIIYNLKKLKSQKEQAVLVTSYKQKYAAQQFQDSKYQTLLSYSMGASSLFLCTICANPAPLFSLVLGITSLAHAGICADSALYCISKKNIFDSKLETDRKTISLIAKTISKAYKQLHTLH